MIGLFSQAPCQDTHPIYHWMLPAKSFTSCCSTVSSNGEDGVKGESSLEQIWPHAFYA